MGVDLALGALRTAQQRSGRALFARADVLRLPVTDGRVDLLVERGGFHYLSAEERSRYVLEARRTLPTGWSAAPSCMLDRRWYPQRTR